MPEVEVARITPFAPIEGNSAVAAVKLVYGEIVVHAKLYRTRDDRLFLKMPFRKGSKEGEYWELVYFRDKRLVAEAEIRAVDAYQRTVGYSPN
ncbi:MAG: hypothetical protein AB1758_26070 [Candidatus Eremiobacterota bacterium]